MRRVVQQVLVAVPAAEGAAVALAAGGVLTHMCASGILLSAIGTRLCPDSSLSGLALRTRSTQRCDDTALDERSIRKRAGWLVPSPWSVCRCCGRSRWWGC